MSDNGTEKIVVIITHGPDDPERALFPFVMANGAMLMDAEATVILQFRHDHTAKVLQVDLMADSLGRGNDPEGFKGLLCPFQERVAFTVAIVFHGHVHGIGGRATEGVDLDGMVDSKVCGHHPVEGDVREGGLGAPPARGVDAEDKALDLLLHLPVALSLTNGAETQVEFLDILVLAEGVGRAATASFVMSFVVILVLDLVISVALDNVYELIWPLIQ